MLDILSLYICLKQESHIFLNVSYSLSDDLMVHKKCQDKLIIA